MTKITGIKTENSKRINLFRNAIEVVPSALLMAAGVIISIAVISVMISQMGTAGELSNAVNDGMLERIDDIRNSSITQYDGLTVNGADVVNFYKKQFDDYRSPGSAPFEIEIDRSNDGKSNGKVYSDYMGVDELKDSASIQYIKPSSQWKCRVEKNMNGIITRVVFVKQ